MIKLPALLVAALLAAPGAARADQRALHTALDPATVARLAQVAPPPPDGVTPAPAPAPAQENPLLTPPAAETVKKDGEAGVPDETPAYKRWWFWALTAAVVGGTVALGAWAVDSGSNPPKGCAATSAVCF